MTGDVTFIVCMSCNSTPLPMYSFMCDLSRADPSKYKVSHFSSLAIPFKWDPCRLLWCICLMNIRFNFTSLFFSSLFEGSFSFLTFLYIRFNFTSLFFSSLFEGSFSFLTFLYIRSFLSVLFFASFFFCLSLFLHPEEDNFCRKRLCAFVSLCFVAFVSTFP